MDKRVVWIFASLMVANGCRSNPSPDPPPAPESTPIEAAAPELSTPEPPAPEQTPEPDPYEPGGPFHQAASNLALGRSRGPLPGAALLLVEDFVGEDQQFGEYMNAFETITGRTRIVHLRARLSFDSEDERLVMNRLRVLAADQESIGDHDFLIALRGEDQFLAAAIRQGAVSWSFSGGESLDGSALDAFFADQAPSDAPLEFRGRQQRVSGVLRTTFRLGYNEMASCYGHSGVLPNHIIHFPRAVSQFHFEFLGDDSEELTVLLRRPNAHFFCPEGLQFSGDFPAGTYLVWVGTPNVTDEGSYDLQITAR